MPGLLDKILPSGLVGKVVDAISSHIPIPVDQTKRMELEAAIEQAVVSGIAQQNQAQAEINKVEAASPQLFVSGWRPFIGWTCGAAIFYNFLVYPVLMSFNVAAVAVDMASLWPLVVGMLGIGTMRTVEKAKGVQANH